MLATMAQRSNSVPEVSASGYLDTSLRYSRHANSSSPTAQQQQQQQPPRRHLVASNAPALFPHHSRHSLRPGTNLPFHDRGAPSDPDDFVSELRRSFVRPREEDLAPGRGTKGRGRVRTALKLEGDQTLSRLNLEQFSMPGRQERTFPLKQTGSISLNSGRRNNSYGRNFSSIDIDSEPVPLRRKSYDYGVATQDIDTIPLHHNGEQRREVNGDVGATRWSADASRDEGGYHRRHYYQRSDSKSVGVQVTVAPTNGVHGGGGRLQSTVTYEEERRSAR